MKALYQLTSHDSPKDLGKFTNTQTSKTMYQLITAFSDMLDIIFLICCIMHMYNILCAVIWVCSGGRLEFYLTQTFVKLLGNENYYENIEARK